MILILVNIFSSSHEILAHCVQSLAQLVHTAT